MATDGIRDTRSPSRVKVSIVETEHPLVFDVRRNCRWRKAVMYYAVAQLAEMEHRSQHARAYTATAMVS